MEPEGNDSTSDGKWGEKEMAGMKRLELLSFTVSILRLKIMKRTTALVGAQLVGRLDDLCDHQTVISIGY